MEEEIRLEKETNVVEIIKDGIGLLERESKEV